jgi:hypothetical protein
VTTPDFSQYQPPGVYVANTSSIIATAAGVAPATLCLVGPALGFRTATQTVSIFAATGTLLTSLGIFTTPVTGPPAISAPTVTTLSGIVLTPGTDYTLTQDTSGPDGAPGATTQIFRVASSSNVSDGQAVQVTYAYADTTYYHPHSFTNFASVMASYGPPLLTSPPAAAGSSQVDIPLSFAAQIAFQNGAGTIICVSLNPSDGDMEEQYLAAYTKLATNFAATIVVPVYADGMTVNTGTVAQFATLLAEDLATSVEAATAGGYPQIGFFGAPDTYNESDQSFAAFAGAITDQRLVLVYPERLNVYNPSTAMTFQTAGCHLAAALGAILSSLPVNTGLTMQQVSGFTSIPATLAQAMTVSFMNTTAAAGVCIVYLNRQGQMQVRQGLTTDMAGVNTREISVIRQGDMLQDMLQIGLQQSSLIGGPITQDTVAAVQGAIAGILEQAVATSVIVAYGALTVQQQIPPGGDPTVIACSFSYAPALPMNYVTVSYAIDLTLGAVSNTSASVSTTTSVSASSSSSTTGATSTG